MDKKDCKIVQDLLPNYIEKLTSSETNEYVERHISECKNCKKVLDIMQNEFDESEKKENIKINYLKKYKRKTTILKTTILIIAIIILVFFGVKVNQWRIICKLYDKNMNYEIGNNYRITYRDGNTGETTYNIYKDGIKYSKLKDICYIWEDENSKYMINPIDKTYLILDKNSPPIINYSSTIKLGTYQLFNGENSKLDLFKLVLFTGINIHEEAYGEHKCYVILFNGEKIWVDKDTLLILRDDFNGKTTEYTIEAGVVKAEDVKLPDLLEYKKLEN